MGAIWVRWPSGGFGDDRVIIDEADFNGDIHRMIGPADLGAADDDGEDGDDDPIFDAIVDMDSEDPDRENDSWWRKDGVPELHELRNRVEGTVTSAERADAWSKYLDATADE